MKIQKRYKLRKENRVLQVICGITDIKVSNMYMLDDGYTSDMNTYWSTYQNLHSRLAVSEQKNKIIKRYQKYGYKMIFKTK
jgi:hypothetical protein